MASHAEKLKDTPDKAVKDAIKAVRDGSASSGSVSRIDLPQDDGSVLVVSSREGDAADLRADNANVQTEEA